MWYSPQNGGPEVNGRIYLFSVGNPVTTFGADLGWVRGNGAVTGLFFGVDFPNTGHTVENIIIDGSSLPFYIQGNHSDITIDNCVSRKWGRHGMRSIGNAVPTAGTIGIPNNNIVFTNCSVYMDTLIAEFDPAGGERGGDGIAVDGPHNGAKILDCFVQDQHHSAYQMGGYNTFIDGVNGYTYGNINFEIARCTADNTNSFYGRLIGSVGRTGSGASDFPNSNGKIHGLSATNMQTRSQISGRNIDVYNNNFSNTSGALVTGGSQVASPIRGEGVDFTSDDTTTFGTKELVNIRCFNNFLCDNSLAGLQVNYGAATGDGGNQFFDNVVKGNNALVDPEDSNVLNAQIYVSGTIPSTDTYTGNHVSGADQDAVFYVVDGSYNTLNFTDFNALRANNSANDGDISSVGVAPDMVGNLNEEQARAELVTRGFIVGDVTYEYCGSAAPAGIDEVDHIDEITNIDELI